MGSLTEREEAFSSHQLHQVKAVEVGGVKVRNLLIKRKFLLLLHKHNKGFVVWYLTMCKLGK